MSKVAVLIPAFNPSPRLLTIVTELLRSDAERLVREIVIVDDGSDNEHAEIFERLRKLERVTVLHHDRNKGKGAALKTGFTHILKNEGGGYVSLVTADADGQHLPRDILNVARESALTPDELVLGVRAFDRDVPFRSMIGNWVTRLVMRFFTGLKVTDTQTGLRAWPLALVRRALSIDKNAYDFEMEALIRARELSDDQLALREVPITTVYEDGNKSSHFRPVLDSMRIYFVFARYCGAGLITALVDNLIFISAFMISSNALASQIVSRTSGALVSFVLNYSVVFLSATNKAMALAKFISLVVLLGGASYGLLQFISQAWNVNVILAKLLAESMLFMVSFLIQRNYIFGHGANDGMRL